MRPHGAGESRILPSYRLRRVALSPRHARTPGLQIAYVEDLPRTDSGLGARTCCAWSPPPRRHQDLRLRLTSHHLPTRLCDRRAQHRRRTRDADTDLLGLSRCRTHPAAWAAGVVSRDDQCSWLFRTLIGVSKGGQRGRARHRVTRDESHNENVRVHFRFNSRHVAGLPAPASGSRRRSAAAVVLRRKRRCTRLRRRGRGCSRSAA